MTTRPSSDLTTWATSGTIVEPSSPEKAAGFDPGDRPPAQWLNFFLSNLALWASYLDTEKLRSVTHTDASIPVFGTPSSAHDHPGSSSNRWKLILKLALSDGTFARFYAGEGDFGDRSQWCIASNAVYDPSPTSGTGQKWSKDNTGKESNLIRCQAGELHWYGRQPGAGVWADTEWDDQQRGTLFVGDTIFTKDLSASGDVSATDDITAGDQVNAGGDMNVGNDINITHACRVHDSIHVDDDFLYSSAKSRQTIVPLCSAHGDTFKNFEGALIMGGSDVVNFPIHLPSGAVLNSVDIMYEKTTADTLDVFTVRKHGMNWSTPTAPTCTQQAHGTSNATGLISFNMIFGSITVSSDEDYELTIQDAHSGDSLHAVRVNWTDPGPRNF